MDGEDHLPLSLFLKAGTSDAHKQAETSVFIKRLMKGGLAKPAYARFIAMLYIIYSYAKHQMYSLALPRTLQSC